MAGGETPARLEQEIADIERQLVEKREVLRRETLHEVVRQKIAASPAPQLPPQMTPPTTSTAPIAEELHQKVQSLVNIAFIKSIEDAIKEAKATNNAAIIDAFHDLLVDELYNHLVERGKLKQL